MLFTLSDNPTAPLMLVSLLLAGALLLAVVPWVIAIDRRYRTAPERRAYRLRPPSAVLTVGGTGLIFTILILAVVASVGDVLTYSQNVKQVQAISSNAGAPASEAQAKALLGNEFNYAFKPIVASASGAVGSAKVRGQNVRLLQVEGKQYILLTDKLGR